MTKVRIILLLTTLMFTCSKQYYNPRLVEYLKAERDLRKRVSEEQGLEDSLRVLQKKYRINVDKELTKLKSNPDAWQHLIKELRNEK